MAVLLALPGPAHACIARGLAAAVVAIPDHAVPDADVEDPDAAALFADPVELDLADDATVTTLHATTLVPPAAPDPDPAAATLV